MENVSNESPSKVMIGGDGGDGGDEEETAI